MTGAGDGSNGRGDLELVVEPPAAVLVLNRPDRRNALSRAIIRQVPDIIQRIAGKADVAGLIITGSGGAFSAGADLTEAVAIATEEEFLAYNAEWQELSDAIEECAKPVIACIEGFCYTGGLELALCCDVRIASTESTFAVTSARIGSVPGFGATQRLPRLVGPGSAKCLMFAADPIDANEAYRIGLVERLVPVGTTLEAGKSLLSHYATRAPVSLALIKQAVNRGVDLNLRDALYLEARLAAQAFATEDKREGMAAFLQKRPAVFQGR